MNGADPGRLLAMRGEMNRGQNNRARIRMTGAQVVKKILAEIVGRIDVEDEKVRPLDSMTNSWASSRLWARSTCAPGAASRRAARMALARCSSGARTRTRPCCWADEEWLGVGSFTIQRRDGALASAASA